MKGLKNISFNYPEYLIFSKYLGVTYNDVLETITIHKTALYIFPNTQLCVTVTTAKSRENSSLLCLIKGEPQITLIINALVLLTTHINVATYNWIRIAWYLCIYLYKFLTLRASSSANWWTKFYTNHTNLSHRKTCPIGLLEAK